MSTTSPTVPAPAKRRCDRATELPAASQRAPTPLRWTASLGWLALAAVSFAVAYSFDHYPIAGLAIIGYVIGLIKITNQATVRRAFYFGLATGYFCYAPQLWFFWKIFSAAAILLWLVLAFWVGLFAAIVWGSRRRWGAKAIWLIPFIWTGIEYFRSELYLLKFTWLNIGYALPPIAGFHTFGVYGIGFLAFATGAVLCHWRTLVHEIRKLPRFVKISLCLTATVVALLGLILPAKAATGQSVTVAGIQLEFPVPAIIPKLLSRTLAKHPDAQIFVLSEYTLDGPVPSTLKDWCREHGRYLVVGGKDPVGANNYYNTAFVVGPTGDLVFKQAKSVPIQFFRDGLPAPTQTVWDSPWGKIGLCVCYDLSYSRVIDRLIRAGAQMLIVPTMDVEYWSRHEHALHSRIAPVRAAECGIPIFRLVSSGISQAVTASGSVIATAPMPGTGAMLAAEFQLPERGQLPWDRWFAPLCVGVTALVLATLLLGDRVMRRRRGAKNQ